MRRVAALLLVVVPLVAFMPLVAVFPVAAQPPSCEDQVRAMRALAEQLSVSRQRGEADMAQAVAALAKQVETLRAAVQALEAEKAKGKEGK